jgi:hypothetical protein
MDTQAPRKSPGEKGPRLPRGRRDGGRRNRKTLKGGTESSPPGLPAALKEKRDIQRIFKVLHSGTVIGKGQ